MKISKEELEELRLVDETDNFVVAERQEWISEGKFEYQDVVLTHKSTGKHYRYAYSRSGSYFTEYFYNTEYEPDEIELDCEVEPILVTVAEWRRVLDLRDNERIS